LNLSTYQKLNFNMLLKLHLIFIIFSKQLFFTSFSCWLLHLLAEILRSLVTKDLGLFVKCKFEFIRLSKLLVFFIWIFIKLAMFRELPLRTFYINNLIRFRNNKIFSLLYIFFNLFGCVSHNLFCMLSHYDRNTKNLRRSYHHCRSFK
jgi:hypothetical protein